MKTLWSATILLLLALFVPGQSKSINKRAVKVSAKITGSATGTVNFECDVSFYFSHSLLSLSKFITILHSYFSSLAIVFECRAKFVV